MNYKGDLIIIQMKKLTILFIFTILCTFVSNAQTDKYKALFIYNFTKHIEWPANQKAEDFVILIVDQKSLYDNLASITTGKKVGSQDIVLKHVSTPEEITPCQILVLGTNNSIPKKLSAIAPTVGANTLVVANGSGAATRGAAINFIIDEGKLKFELNKTETAAKGLKVSSYLENIAVVIQ